MIVFLHYEIPTFLLILPSPSSHNILYLLPNPFQKLLQQIHLSNHKLLHKLIRLFQLILQASFLLPEHLILITQLYHLLLQIIITIDSSQKFLLKPFRLLQFNLSLLRLPLCGVRYHHPDEYKHQSHITADYEAGTFLHNPSTPTL